MQPHTIRSVRPTRPGLTLGTGLLLALLAIPALAADVGEDAPELDVTDWVQAELKLTENPGKKIRVLQFFSTVDAASVTAMDEMEKWKAELGAKVEFIAISTQGKTTIATFLETHKVTYSVAVDGYDNTTAEYMGKGKSLPYYVIVNGDGKVAWSGPKASDPREALDQMIGGTFDLERHRKLDAARRKLRDMDSSATMDDREAAFDELLELDPSDAGTFNVRVQLLNFRRDAERFITWARKYAEWAKDDATALNMLAWNLVTNESYEWRDPELALSSSKRAVDIAKEDEKGAVIDTYARALYQAGLVDAAITQQKTAIGLAKEEDQKKELEKTLKYYEAAKKAQKSVK